MKTYPVVDRLNSEERKHFGITGENMPLLGGIKAVYSGVKRCPKAGEWYLSGAIVEAYKAPNDLSTPYHIAKLVKIETVTTERIIQH